MILRRNYDGNEGTRLQNAKIDVSNRMEMTMVITERLTPSELMKETQVTKLSHQNISPAHHVAILHDKSLAA